MQRILWVTIILLASLGTIMADDGGVAINNDGSKAHGSAILDVQSTSKGMLIPRMTQAERLAITGPANGLFVYQTDAPQGFFFFDGTPAVNAWIGPLGSGNGTVTSVTGALPLSVANGTTTPAISIAKAGASADGYLSSADWSTFNSKGSGSVTSVGTSGPLTGGPITGSGTIGITKATSSADGYLSSADWSTFNSKGTFTLPALTSGSILFSDGSTIAQDNANLYWDNASNRLGIGGTPSYKLDVQASASSSYAARIYNSSTSGNGLIIRAGANPGNGNTVLSLRDNANTETFNVRDYGCVTIGSQSLDHGLLGVHGNVGSFGAYYMATIENDSTSGGGMLIKAGGNPGTGSEYLLVLADNKGDIKFYVRDDGNGWMAGTLNQASDARLKKDVRPLSGTLEKIKQLRGVSFVRTDDPGNQRQIGVIAQELEAQFPELVETGRDGMKSVAYANLTAVLIEGIKEQQDQLNTLKAENEALRRDLEQGAAGRGRSSGQPGEIGALKAQLETMKADMEQVKRMLSLPQAK